MEWTLPCEPELLYLREKTKRLEAELYYLKGLDQPTITEPPPVVTVITLPPYYQLTPMVSASSREAGHNNPMSYHILLKAVKGLESIEYGYYVSKPELYNTTDRLGMMAELHRRVIHSLARFIEDK